MYIGVRVHLKDTYIYYAFAIIFLIKDVSLSILINNFCRYCFI